MGDSESETHEGYDLLGRAWFDAIYELRATILASEDARLRVDAAEVLLKYTISMGQSINIPWVPEKNPSEVEDDEDE